MGLAHLRSARGSSMSWRRFLLAALLLMPCGAHAHEIGTTQVQFTLHRDHTWSATITTGPQSLANKLEAETGQPHSSDLNADTLRAEITALASVLANNIDVRFDGAGSPVQRLGVATRIAGRYNLAVVRRAARERAGARACASRHLALRPGLQHLCRGVHRRGRRQPGHAMARRRCHEPPVSRSPPMSGRRPASKSSRNICSSDSCTSFRKGSITFCSCSEYFC